MKPRQVAVLREVGRHRRELDEAVRLWPRMEREKVEQAAAFAEQAHDGQRRRTGEPYVCHPLSVATIVAQNGGDTQTVLAALLHDTVEDTPIELADIEASFGGEVAIIVDGCTKVKHSYEPHEGALATARTRKFVRAIAQDPRVLLVKIADRTHNLRTARGLDPAKAKRIGEETLGLYVPIARRLGLGKLAEDLQDLAFKVARPEDYRATVGQLDKIARGRTLERARAELERTLRKRGCTAEVHSRVKSPWSAYAKSHEENVPLEALPDLLALRVLVLTRDECYRALGTVHEIWTPVEGKIKDYIAKPKFNSYQSLHTAVEAYGKVIEVQIRTQAMHDQAEHGSAAHHVYKTEERVGPDWLERILEWGDSHDYLEGIRAELASDEEVHVLTPKGASVSLPKGACVIDFAYAVHTEVGDRCSGAKVNGHLVPLSTHLRTGDQVEIITHRTSGPSTAWLAWAATHKAKARIRSFNNSVRTRSTMTEGRIAIEEALRKRNTTWASWALALPREVTSEKISELVGLGQLTAEDAASNCGLSNVVTGSKRSAIAARSLEGLRIALARCCTPQPGSPLIGVLPAKTRRPAQAHLDSCVQGLAHIADNPLRAIDLKWVGPDMLWSTLEAQGQDRPGILGDVAAAISAAGGEIESSTTMRRPDGSFVETFDVIYPRNAHLTLLRMVRAVSGVASATLG